ncbi:MAG: hypothetical protein EP334_10040 [Gammaproteobacteria bacterium]|nr:MAG: hypothetical protein EP334_10040 [Gammaproteobacteria bacterium]
MSLTLVTAPSQQPITTAEAKAHLNISHSLDDALIAAYIAAATEYAEAYLGRDLIQRTWDYSADAFPSGGNAFCLPKNPVQSITSISYVDGNGDTQALATSVYSLDKGVAPAEVYLQYGQSWPSVRGQRNAVTVRFVSGYAPSGSPQDLAGNVPDSIKSAIKLIVGDLYLNRERKMDVQVYYNDTADLLLHPHRLYKV